MKRVLFYAVDIDLCEPEAVRAIELLTSDLVNGWAGERLVVNDEPAIGRFQEEIDEAGHALASFGLQRGRLDLLHPAGQLTSAGQGQCILAWPQPGRV